MILNFIKKIFSIFSIDRAVERSFDKRKAKEIKKEDAEAIANRTGADKEVLQTIIAKLETCPTEFSANWSYNNSTLDSSVRHLNGSILIMYTTGEIIDPFRIKLTSTEKRRIVDLCEPIVKKSIEQIVDGVLKL